MKNIVLSLALAFISILTTTSTPTTLAMTQNTWIDDIQMEPYDIPLTQDDDTTAQSPSLQIPAGIVWKRNNDSNDTESLNLATCVEATTPETILRWKAIQKSEFLMKQVVKDDSDKTRGSLPAGTCRIHLGGDAIQLEPAAAIQIVDDDYQFHLDCDLILGSGFITQHNIELDHVNHQLKVPKDSKAIGDTGTSTDFVTVPFIQPRSEIAMPDK